MGMEPRRRSRHDGLIRMVVLVVLSLLAGGPVARAAEDAPPPAPALPIALLALWPELKPEDVAAAPLPGWREVQLPSGGFAYLDPSARYLFLGSLFDLALARNPSEDRLAVRRQALASAIPDPDVLWLKPAQSPVGRLYVFDDPDCPFCRKVHPELQAALAKGLEVGVLLYPVLRLHPQAYAKSVGIWCAPNRREALDAAFSGKPIAIPEAPCAHPVDRNLQRGRQLGVTGTPWFLAPDGRSLAGYHSAADLLSFAQGAPARP